ncbi:trans-1,2-dihydrobenzene-1,2-diol dehydrogenase-like [Odontesthes bonariensis]|uniref:trans-1,2-dihydrobenzene-1,2-diol dehydrogenase-like n=1 Tax=Odontesthes bonariensis TaxID=219752 RepID=UPI003F58FAB2
MATRWGICSAGKISHDFAVALKTLPAEDHQVVAVAARKLGDAQEFAKKHSISRAYGSYEELARDPDIVGIVHLYVIVGVDETGAVILKFSNNRMAVFTYSSGLELPNDAVIVGTKGIIRVPGRIWCPTSLVVNGKETLYPIPEPCLPLNFINSTGMRYEAEEVRQCLLKGLKESAVISHADSLLLAEVEDEIRRQVGVVYSQDCQ